MKRAYPFLLVAVFIALRLALFNINIAEWGDSYDFLRIAENLTHGQYPLDAKRLPVFPLLIAPGMLFMDAVLWAKIVVLLASAGCLFLTYKLTKKLFPTLSENDLRFTIYGLLFSPIFLYWSIRVVAEPVFAFFVLLAFYLFYLDRRSLGVWGILGVVCGLAAMTRYEGFFLFGAIGLGVATKGIKGVKGVNLRPLILYSLFFILIISPWFLRNYVLFGKLFYSPYTSDPAGFASGAYYRWQWLYYTLFMFGFPFGFYFLLQGFWERRREWLKYLPFFFFTSSSLLLFFVWYPHARFYLYLIPLLLPFVVVGLRRICESPTRWHSVGVLLLSIIYLFGVWKFRFYDLGPGKLVKALVLGSGLLAVVWLVAVKFRQQLRKYSPAVLLSLALLSEAAISFGVISNQRLIYSSVYYATHDPIIFDKKVTFFDETGVTMWYLRRTGVYYNQDLLPSEQLNWLRDNQVDYVLWTNEHNEGSELTIVSDSNFVDHFRLVREYSYRVGETEFASRIYEFLK